jgi:hypothetical protein
LARRATSIAPSSSSASPGLGVGYASEHGHQRHIVGHIKKVQQIRRLEHKADAVSQLAARAIEAFSAASRWSRSTGSISTKCHWFHFLVWCISGPRSPLLFLVELGAAIKVASMAVPFLSSRPLAANVLLPVASI